MWVVSDLVDGDCVDDLVKLNDPYWASSRKATPRLVELSKTISHLHKCPSCTISMSYQPHQKNVPSLNIALELSMLHN